MPDVNVRFGSVLFYKQRTDEIPIQMEIRWFLFFFVPLKCYRSNLTLLYVDMLLKCLEYSRSTFSSAVTKLLSAVTQLTTRSGKTQQKLACHWDTVSFSALEDQICVKNVYVKKEILLAF